MSQAFQVSHNPDQPPAHDSGIRGKNVLKQLSANQTQSLKSVFIQALFQVHSKASSVFSLFHSNEFTFFPVDEKGGGGRRQSVVAWHPGSGFMTELPHLKKSGLPHTGQNWPSVVLENEFGALCAWQQLGPEGS